MHSPDASGGSAAVNPAQKALWYIESHLARPLSLEQVPTIAGVSRFHLVRAFAAATGLSVMRVGKVAYGVCCNGDDSGNFDFIAGVEVSEFSDLPRDFSRVRIPEQRYAVFSHKDHISTIRRTVNTIWNHWLPRSGLKAADAPSFERYDENFDPLTGNGGLEIWVPIRE